KTNYDFAGMGAHDVSGTGATGVLNGQLAANPFAGARIVPDPDRVLEGVIDEAAVWQGTQKVSQVLALFRARYAPAAGSPIIDAGDPRDVDSLGRKADIGAIDSGGHDLDQLGKFGTPSSDATAPTISMTAPTSGATLSGTATLSANASDNVGVVGVQFLVDGAAAGAEDTTAPYSIAFNTAILTN